MSTKYTVLLNGWNEGFRTIDMMKLVRERTGMLLGDAMASVNRIVEGGTEALSFSNIEDAEAFLRDALQTGVKARLQVDDD